MHYYLDIPNSKFRFMRIACTKGAYYRVLPDSCLEKKEKGERESSSAARDTSNEEEALVGGDTWGGSVVFTFPLSCIDLLK